jgi:dienelactone hydrolase
MTALAGNFLSSALIVCLLAGAPAWSQTAPDRPTIRFVKPSEADAEIKRFDDPNYVIVRPQATEHPPLVVFMPGTGGKPENAALLLGVIANQGYRVIGLEYNDKPAVIQTCPHNPDPDCSAKFRRKRIFGDDVTAVVDNTPAESIVNRMVKLLRYLDRRYPDEKWGFYLAGDQPDWIHIVVAGLSQGAGMAAFIAKQKAVARVVLFSSPWDFYGPPRRLAPWIAERGATSPERWFAEYHKRENTAELIAEAYRALRIPEANLRIFDLDLPAEARNQQGENPFHGSTIRMPGYIPQWQFLFGRWPG